jgi:uncharacterized protein
MTWFERWHSVAVRRFGILNLAAAALGVWLCVDASRTQISADWLGLFAPDDPVFREYLASGAVTAGSRNVYVRLSPAGAVETGLRDAVGRLATVFRVTPIPLVSGGGGRWIQVELRTAPPLSASERRAAIEQIRGVLLRADPGACLTGSDIILDEFSDSVMRDFVRTSIVALLLVAAVVLAFGRSRAVVLGFGYQLLGLLASLAVCRHAGVRMNMLSVALPCVLVGLGIDFVIHVVAASSHGGPSADGQYGLRAYARVVRPMFWGVVTTGLAFFSLCLAELPGLRAVGVLGGVSMVLMFVFVILLLPPAISRLGVGGQGSGAGRVLFSRATALSCRGRTGVALGIGVACLLLAVGIPSLRVEDRVENLYDPDMPALRLQSELTAASGVYPSVLFLSFESADAPRVLSALRRSVRGIVPLDVIARSGRTTVRFLSRANPFDGHVRAAISQELAAVVAENGGSSPLVTGDAVLCSHMNDLLVSGMLRVFAVVAGMLGIVLAIAFRRVRYIACPMAALGLGVVGVLGLLGLSGVRLSAYNLTLFPLFVGIGVDDCLYVCHMFAGGQTFRERPDVLQGVTLTTLTTLMGYGALVVARNLGFRAMGVTAMAGLSLTYLAAVFVLPAMLRAGAD